MAFESGAPASKEECAQTILCGGRNKWFDKSFTVVIFENGRGGINAEHTPVDAMTVRPRHQPQPLAEPLAQPLASHYPSPPP